MTWSEMVCRLLTVWVKNTDAVAAEVQLVGGPLAVLSKRLVNRSS